MQFHHRSEKAKHRKPTAVPKSRKAPHCGALWPDRRVYHGGPLSSTFFGKPKLPDLPLKPAAVVSLPMLFSLWRYPRKTSSPTSAHTGLTRLAASSTSPDAAPSTKASHSPSQAATIGGFAPELQHLKHAPLPVSGVPYLVYSGVDFDCFPPRTGAIPSGFRCPPALAGL